MMSPDVVEMNIHTLDENIKSVIANLNKETEARQEAERQILVLRQEVAALQQLFNVFRAQNAGHGPTSIGSTG